MSAHKMPALFLAHGNPMNAIADNEFTRSLRHVATQLPQPQAILVISAHWLTTGTQVLATQTPRTIHDFGGFPPELYEIQYPAPGSLEIALRVAELLPTASPVDDWGLDHAAWTVLRHMWPDADIPTLELSLDLSLSPAEHWELGRRLASLREQGVLLVGSGNIVHSFAGISWEPDAAPQPWALEFDTWIADALVRRDDDALIGFHQAGPMAALSVPTPDHYLPLLYAAATRDENDALSFPFTGIDMASMSMRCVRFG